VTILLFGDECCDSVGIDRTVCGRRPSRSVDCQQYASYRPGHLERKGADIDVSQTSFDEPLLQQDPGSRVADRPNAMCAKNTPGLEVISRKLSLHVVGIDGAHHTARPRHPRQLLKDSHRVFDMFEEPLRSSCIGDAIVERKIMRISDMELRRYTRRSNTLASAANHRLGQIRSNNSPSWTDDACEVNQQLANAAASVNHGAARLEFETGETSSTPRSQRRGSRRQEGFEAAGLTARVDPAEI